ncbi:hypothetical protein I4F81_007775 [Pyropia yezoensis]|uniref:Uncharacterized protein n=1 Tax=Pyropia yezoensis TaxID=2788 RepID=A0ACC3C5J4_PYRYE|nr:hypothetical protein I4F81_007775 [Neopyropia yezoensis]
MAFTIGPSTTTAAFLPPLQTPLPRLAGHVAAGAATAVKRPGVAPRWATSHQRRAPPRAVTISMATPPPPPSSSSPPPAVAADGGSASSAAPALGGDLLILGAGTLGSIAARLWMDGGRDGGPPRSVVAETRTERRHDALRAGGAVPRTREQADAADAAAAGGGSDGGGGDDSTASPAIAPAVTFSNVLFCMPPSSSDDYVAEACRAVACWRGPSAGRLVFTSTAGAYAEENGGVVTEGSPTTPGGGRLGAAEAVIATAGGTVVRLAGLYALGRGAHKFWPVTRRELVDAALAHPTFAGAKAPVFEADIPSPLPGGVPMPAERGGLGKAIDCSRTWEVLGWKPRFESYDAFMRGGCTDNV